MSAYDYLLEQVKTRLGKREPIRYSGFGTFDIKPRRQGFFMNFMRSMVRNGVFATTDKQLMLCVKKRGVSQYYSYPYKQIEQVSLGRSTLGAYLDVTTAEHKVRLRLLDQNLLPHIENLIQKHQNTAIKSSKKQIIK